MARRTRVVEVIVRSPILYAPRTTSACLVRERATLRRWISAQPPALRPLVGAAIHAAREAPRREFWRVGAQIFDLVRAVLRRELSLISGLVRRDDIPGMIASYERVVRERHRQRCLGMDRLDLPFVARLRDHMYRRYLERLIGQRRRPCRVYSLVDRRGWA